MDFLHGGGVMSYVIERFLGGAQAEIVPGIVTKGQDGAAPKNVPGGTLAEIRKLHYDTAQASNPVAMGRASESRAGLADFVRHRLLVSHRGGNGTRPGHQQSIHRCRNAHDRSGQRREVNAEVQDLNVRVRGCGGNHRRVPGRESFSRGHASDRAGDRRASVSEVQSTVVRSLFKLRRHKE